MDTNDAKLIDLGVLRGESNADLWQGVISYQKRLAAGEITEDEVAASLAVLADYFTIATPGAAKRCIDGSTIDGYDDTNPKWSQRALGPQIQGGSVDEAIALRLADGNFDNVSILSDIENLPSTRKSRFAEGDHTDDHADETKTGCGAIDGQQRKLAKYNDSAASVIEATVTTLLGLANKALPHDAFATLQTAAAGLAKKPEYFAPADDILGKLREQNPDGIETLIRPHAEVSLTINFVPNTTFNRDHYNARTGSKIQNFNLDAWVFLEEYGDKAYLLFADAVATAMDLTDGSLRLFGRMPA